MGDRALDILQRRVDELLEMLQGINGDIARQMEQEISKIQDIIDLFRSNAADPD